jgi:prophage regulatory protein
MEKVETEFNPIVVRSSQLREVTGLSTSTVWRLERAGKFPRRRKIGDGCVGWLYAELKQYFENSEVL